MSLSGGTIIWLITVSIRNVITVPLAASALLMNWWLKPTWIQPNKRKKKIIKNSNQRKRGKRNNKDVTHGCVFVKTAGGLVTGLFGSSVMFRFPRRQFQFFFMGPDLSSEIPNDFYVFLYGDSNWLFFVFYPMKFRLIRCLIEIPMNSFELFNFFLKFSNLIVWFIWYFLIYETWFELFEVIIQI